VKGAVVAALVLLVSLGPADAALSWTATSTLTTSATSVLVQFASGAGSTNLRHLSSFSLSTNKTSFTATLVGLPGGDSNVTDVARVTNAGASSATVTLTASQVTTANVNTLNWTVRTSSSTVGTMNVTAASPSITFTLASGATDFLDLRYKLAPGSGTNNATPTFTLSLALAPVGGLSVTYASATESSIVRTVEVPLAALVAGSTGGLNGTRGAASVANQLVLTTTDMLYLNNTNATGAWFAKLVLTSSSGLTGITSLTIGINNGTSTAQIVGSLGSMTQTSGPYVKLETSSTNKIYLTQTTTALQSTSTFAFDVYAADSATEAGLVLTSGTITIT
jgi:hypothetical protein